uniref:GDP-Man:Man(3)GlcNAc(2)-PP-Dol alpha-1,2-mannosyltransferase n=1 Tax=Albugo laibachii Nc14 TaxID=890382 RepID=F0W6G1_9STRA|nr:conserved hypothetical protein [Albugo laibachii Nc14]CCA21812.1 conserved hypothetical protein [Albugo laibachii Nc14]|eukprot:CCA21812.1 conserved hypothetical protein [Albugo laibachii Nc14]
MLWLLWLLLPTFALYVWKKRNEYSRRRYCSVLDGTDDGDRLPKCIVTVGIFHPYANGGGGGERVLYCFLESLIEHFLVNRSHQHLRIVLYTGDDRIDKHELIQKAASRFNLPQLNKVEQHLHLVILRNRELLEPSRYPRFTLLCQSIAHIRVARHAFRQGERAGYFPQYWVDTTGCPFSYPVAKYFYGCKVIAYVHYPMISSDMTERVRNRCAEFNNDATIANSSLRSNCKYAYYRMFSWIYYTAGCCTDRVMVNSTWTYEHIFHMWRIKADIVYPPCGDMAYVTDNNIERKPWILSISQFRPEKNQLLQLQAMRWLLRNYKDEIHQEFPTIKLVLLGSCRNEEDVNRVEMLKGKAKEYGIAENVDFIVNASFQKLTYYLQNCTVGIHTMCKEHFGIGIVEMMAAGLIVIAHNSGGPAFDIIQEGAGYLADTVEEYGQHVYNILRTPTLKLAEMQQLSAASVKRRFSDAQFRQKLLAVWESII